MTTSEIRSDENTKSVHVSIWELPAIIVVASIMHWATLALQIPMLTSLDEWFWPFTNKPAGTPWLTLSLLVVPIVVIRKIFRMADNKYLQKLFLTFLIGLVMQFGFSLLEGRGIDGMRDRIVRTGHAKFAFIATQQESILYAVRDYEGLLQIDDYGKAARSKPPGQLLLYMFTQRVASWINPKTDFQERLDWFQTFASYLWPLLSYLVLIPMFYFTHKFIGPKKATTACILYLFIPSVNLITLHTDQVFFPALSMSCIFLAALACHKQHLALSFITGFVIYITLFCSFGLIFVLPLVAATCFAISYSLEKNTQKFKVLVKTGLGILAGMIVLDIIFRIVFNYDIWIRYQNAMASHTATKGWDWSAKTVTYFAFLNSLEYIVWIGIPIAFLVFLHWIRSIEHVIQGDFRIRFFLSSVLLGVFLMLALFGQTKAEVARLWLFLVPFICVLVQLGVNPSAV